MAGKGLFPDFGVEAGSANVAGGVSYAVEIDPVNGCVILYHRNGCKVEFTREQANFLLANWARALDSAGMAYDCADEDELAEMMSRHASLGVFGVGGGTANAQTVTAIGYTVAPKALFDGMEVAYLPAATVTGAATLAAFGLPAKPIVDEGGNALTGNEIVITRMTAMRYENESGGRWRLYPWANAKLANVAGRRTVYATPGTYTFTVPAGVTQVDVEVWGAGGGGGGSGDGSLGGVAGNYGGGGGAGGYARKLCTVTPGQSVLVTVGAGGAGTTTGPGGVPGGSSSFGAFCSAGGGFGGAWGQATQVNTGAGGSGVGGDLNIGGGAGGPTGPNSATVTTSTANTPYAQSGSPPMGTAALVWQTGASPVGYAAGGAGASGGSNAIGGNGAPGLVIVRW